MPKLKCTIKEVVPIKKHKQNPIIGKLWKLIFKRGLKLEISYHFFSFTARYQNGEISDEFAQSLDVCLATDTQTEDHSPVLMTISNKNVYDGYVNKNARTDLKRKFIAVRKANTNNVSKPKLNFEHKCNLSLLNRSS